FVVCHEYGHHILGHRRQTDEQGFWLEIDDSGEGNIGEQARELDADACAIYFVLHHIILGTRREKSLRGLSVKAGDSRADAILLSSVIVALGAFFLTRPGGPFDVKQLRTVTHPPQNE